MRRAVELTCSWIRVYLDPPTTFNCPWGLGAYTLNPILQTRSRAVDQFIHIDPNLSLGRNSESCLLLLLLLLLLPLLLLLLLYLHVHTSILNLIPHQPTFNNKRSYNVI